MNARSFLVDIARVLERLRFDTVLIGNAAAALQGAPVTTIDFDFLFRKTPRNLGKLKDLARALDAMVLRPYYPVSDLFRVVRERDGLQLDFMGTVHGLRSFAGVRARATLIEIDGVPLRVATLADIIKSKRAAAARGTSRSWISWRRPVKKRIGRRRKLAALALESERTLIDMIRRWQALPPGRRTHFLRKRVAFRGTAL